MHEDRTLLKAFKKTNKSAGLVGVHANPGGLAVAHSESGSAERAKLAGCEFVPSHVQAEPKTALNEVVAKLGIEGADTNYVLASNQYSVLMMEPPEVPAEELKQAVRWRVKDMVSFNVDDAALDIILLPQDAFTNRTPMIYVVVAQKSVIDEAEQLIGDAGLRLKYIDVAELALFNLLSDEQMSDQGLALMYPNQTEGLINIERNQSLYLSRKLRVDMERLNAPNLAETEAFNSLLLEVQRSLDYYESQLGQKQVTQLWLTPLRAESKHLADDITTNLGIQAHIIDLDTVLEDSGEISDELLEHSALAIAGSLRRD